MPVLFSNNASAPLASSISSSATTIVVTTGQGALFPAITGTNYFYATLTNSSNQLEIVKVTARSSDSFTVVRGQEATTAQAYAAADKLELRVTAAGLNAMVQFDAATAANGAVAYSTGTLQSYTAAGTAGQILSSAGASSPVWIAQSAIAAGSATNAGFATNAGYATNAGTANSASFATNAGYATTAGYATNAGTATLATLATSATALTTASGSAPSYSARAWVNFDGTGTISIRASGNVSSISDLGAGVYGVNFSTAMQDANYCVQVASLVTTASNSFNNITSITMSAINIHHVENNAFVDTTSMYVAAFR
jgi:hypothetical protein